MGSGDLVEIIEPGCRSVDFCSPFFSGSICSVMLILLVSRVASESWAVNRHQAQALSMHYCIELTRPELAQEKEVGPVLRTPEYVAASWLYPAIHTRGSGSIMASPRGLPCCLSPSTTPNLAPPVQVATRVKSR